MNTRENATRVASVTSLRKSIGLLIISTSSILESTIRNTNGGSGPLAMERFEENFANDSGCSILFTELFTTDCSKRRWTSPECFKYDFVNDSMMVKRETIRGELLKMRDSRVPVYHDVWLFL